MFLRHGLLLLLPLAAAGAPLLQEAYPNPWTPGEPEEYVTIADSSPSPADLSGWLLSDGEGNLTLPPGTRLEPGVSLTIARNATAHRSVSLSWPDFEVEDSAPEVAQVPSNGSFRLANDGDEVVLRDAQGRVADSLAYGDSPGAPGWAGPAVPKPPQGGLLFRWGPDTDTAADWRGPRTLRAGQTRLPPSPLALRNVTLFTSPESALAATVDFVRSARERVAAEVYLFDHRLLAQELADAVRRGVRVELLLEGSPVGGAPNRALLGDLAEAGVNVTLLQTPRYRFMHGKFAVSDGREALLMTENWNSAGLSATGRGNRGWGLRAESGPLAALLEEVHRLDRTLRPGDSLNWVDRGGSLLRVETALPAPGSVQRLEALNATLLLGPDAGLLELRALLSSARERIDLLQQTVDPTWENETSPLLEEVLRAARRGVQVRILHEYGDLADLRERARGLPLETRAFVPHGRVLGLHAKGVVVDDRVLLSSFNWGANSFLNNREAGLLLENGTAADFFRASFEEDWRAAGAGFPWWPFLAAAVPALLYMRWRRRRAG